MKYIEKAIFHNFKRFKHLELPFDRTRNVLIGDNESGKSSVLLGLHLVLSGSRSLFEQYGVERLLNSDAVNAFNKKDVHALTDLPRMYVELWLSPQGNFELNGKNNSKGTTADGLVMECIPNDDYSREIGEIINKPNATFPFDFYQVKFSTFQGDQYSGYKKFLRHLLVDTTSTGSEYAMREFVKSVYESNAGAVEQHQFQHQYRASKESFRNTVLKSLNDRLTDYDFAVKHDQRANLSSDLTILEGNISIDNRGMGRQCFVKADFALAKANSTSSRPIDIILLEEPENHLSHLLMHNLVSRIVHSADRQIFVATHSNMLTARLDLRKAIFLHSGSEEFAHLHSVTPETAEFFIKAPDHGLLNFVLSKRVILVEGDAEFILMERFFGQVKSKKPAELGVYVLSVGGTSFKRYLEVARLLGQRVAVLRDNDGDHRTKCVERFKEHVSSAIRVFYETDDAFHTFERCLYRDNTEVCNELFQAERKAISVEKYMLDNKTDCALKLLETSLTLTVPKYIREAITWISE